MDYFVFLMMGIGCLIGYASWRAINWFVVARHKQAEVESNHYSILEQITDGVAIVDMATLRPVEMNKAYLWLLGITEEEALQRSFFDYAVECGSLREKIALVTGQGKRLKGECVFEADDGVQVTAEVSISRMMHAGQPHICLIVHDVTERHLVELELEAHRQHLELLVDDRTEELTRVNEQLSVDNARRRKAEAALTYRFDFERLIASISTRFITVPVAEMDKGVNEALRLVGEFAEVDRCYIYRFSPDRKFFAKKYEWCREGVEPSIHRLGSVTTDQFPWFFEQMLDKKPVMVNSLAEIPADESQLLAELNRQNIRAMLTLPMILGDEVVGFLGFSVVHGERVWSDDVVALLKMVGDIFANAFGRKVVEEALTDSEQLMKNLIEAIPDGIVYKDGEGKWLLANQTVRRGLGITGNSWAGRDDGEMAELAPSDREFILVNARTDSEVWESGRAIRHEAVTSTGGKRSKVLEILKVPLFNADGSRQGIISISRDISERKEAEIQLKKARDLALRSAQMKSDFMANMSHEIRTPMNGILGMLDLTLQTDVDEKQREFVTLARDSAHSLLSIINDILDFSKIEAGKLDIERVHFSLSDVVNESVGVVRFAAQQKQIALEMKFADGLPDCLLGDPFRLRQILINLVGNAVKFTEQGSVTVSVSGSRVNETKIFVELTVKDTGIGIPAERLEHIFESFTQVDGSITRKYGGTGLGLAIVNQLVNLMGGDVRVTSTPDAGSEFFVSLPLTVAKREVIETADASLPGSSNDLPDLRGLSFLLAEDNKVNQRVVEGILSGEGCRVTVAGDGKQVLAAVAKTEFDLILMDVQMPVMDGIEATRLLRERGVNVPIVALTAHALKGDRDICLAAGMNDYVAKPIDAERLLAVIGRFVPKREVRSPKKEGAKRKKSKAEVPLKVVRSKVEEIPALPATAPDEIDNGKTAGMFDSQYALKNLQGNRELLKDIVTIFLMEAPPLMHRLREAFEKNNGEDARRFAHSLKGMFGNVGAAAMADDCYAIQYGAEGAEISGLLDSFQRIELGYPLLERELRHFIQVNKPAPATPGKLRTLIVEDDFMTRHILKELLSGYGSIDVAVDGNEAILSFQDALEREQPYGLICMDIKMQKIDGQEALKRIRSIEADHGVRGAEEVKVIMMTALDDPRSVVEAMYRGGATSYIVKPVDAGKLVEELEGLGLVNAA